MQAIPPGNVKGLRPNVLEGPPLESGPSVSFIVTADIYPVAMAVLEGL